MSKKYNKELNSKEWKLKRLEVLQRDKYKCLECGISENLHVHHNYYTNGKKAWEYPLKAFKTLCNKCHKKHHEENKIVVKSLVKQKSRKDRNKDRIDKMILNLSAKDLELHKRYMKHSK